MRPSVRASGLRRACVAVALLGLVAGPQSGAQDPSPLATDLVERTGARLMLLDVTVTDKQGNPVHDLTKADFRVKLNGKTWPISSVDDLCDCPERQIAELGERDETGNLAATPETTREAPSDDRTEAAVRSTAKDTVRFVLYFDFSQLAIDGRVFAVEEARRWVVETMQSSDEVMVVAYTSRHGTRTLSRFTRDKQALLEVIDAAYSDPTLVDDFPMARRNRIEACLECCRRLCPPLLTTARSARCATGYASMQVPAPSTLTRSTRSKR